MAKITRKTQKVFGESAGATGIVEYGSPASGTAVYSDDPDDIQTSAWLIGWSAAALSGTEIPTFQDFNGIHFVATRQIGYLLQEGIAEYDAGTEYHANSIVKKSGTYELYGSIINSNTGNALPSQTDNASWQYLGDLSQLVNVSGDAFANQLLHVQDQKASGTDGGSSSSGFNTRVINTVVTNEISGASLSSNQITLPAGTYYVEGMSQSNEGDSTKNTLYNVTDAQYEVIGQTSYNSVPLTETSDEFVGRFTIDDTKVFEVRHYIANAVATYGLGRVVSASGLIEIYTDVRIWKVA